MFVLLDGNKYSPRKFCRRRCKIVGPPRPRNTGDSNDREQRSDVRPDSRVPDRFLERRRPWNSSSCTAYIDPGRIDCRNCRYPFPTCTRLSAATSIFDCLLTMTCVRGNIDQRTVRIASSNQANSTYLCNVDNILRNRERSSSQGSVAPGRPVSRTLIDRQRCICK